LNGDGGGILIVWSLVGGADIGGSSLAGSHRLQLLDLDVAGESFSTGAEVDVEEVPDADDVTDTGRLASKTNRELVPVDMGLVRTGDMVLRNSRYADGGVMGVLISSSRLMLAKSGVVAEWTMGDLSSDG
jgi:hypothetical protein